MRTSQIGVVQSCSLEEQAHPVHDEREDDDRRDRVADPERDAEPELEALGHDRALEREEDERECSEDDVRDHRPVVAEPAAAGDEVEVEVVARGVVGQREARQEDDDREDQDPPERVRPCRRRCRCSRRSRNRRDRRCRRGRRWPRHRPTTSGSCAARTGGCSPDEASLALLAGVPLGGADCARVGSTSCDTLLFPSRPDPGPSPGPGQPPRHPA